MDDEKFRRATRRRAERVLPGQLSVELLSRERVDAHDAGAAQHPVRRVGGRGCDETARVRVTLRGGGAVPDAEKRQASRHESPVTEYHVVYRKYLFTFFILNNHLSHFFTSKNVEVKMRNFLTSVKSNI